MESTFCVKPQNEVWTPAPLRQDGPPDRNQQQTER